MADDQPPSSRSARQPLARIVAPQQALERARDVQQQALGRAREVSQNARDVALGALEVAQQARDVAAQIDQSRKRMTNAVQSVQVVPLTRGRELVRQSTQRATTNLFSGLWRALAAVNPLRSAPQEHQWRAGGPHVRVVYPGGQEPPPLVDLPLAHPSDLPAPTDYSYHLPGRWGRLDLRPGKLERSVERWARRHVRWHRYLRPYQEAMAYQAHHETDHGRRQGARMMSMFAELIGGELVLIAFSLMVVRIGPQPGESRGLEAEGIAQYLRESGQFDRAAEIDIVPTAHVAGVRVRARETRSYPRRGRRPAALVRYYIPFPHRRDAVVLSFSSPVAALPEPVLFMLDHAAASFHYRWD